MSTEPQHTCPSCGNELSGAMEFCAGLAAVHKQKLVHRDIKPSNIMVSLEEGGAVTAKIIDLGLAVFGTVPGRTS